MTLQPADLDRLEQLAREATPGPWGVFAGYDGLRTIAIMRSPDENVSIVAAPDAPLTFDNAPFDLTYRNAAYIAALDPAVVSELVAAARLGAADAIELAECREQLRSVRALAEIAEALPVRSTLDAAWQAAEAALPEGHVLAELRRFDLGTEWAASTDNTTEVGRYHWSGSGPTPEAALRDLAAVLAGVGHAS